MGTNNAGGFTPEEGWDPFRDVPPNWEKPVDSGVSVQKSKTSGGPTFDIYVDPLEGQTITYNGTAHF